MNIIKTRGQSNIKIMDVPDVSKYVKYCPLEYSKIDLESRSICSLNCNGRTLHSRRSVNWAVSIREIYHYLTYCPGMGFFFGGGLSGNWSFVSVADPRSSLIMP